MSKRIRRVRAVTDKEGARIYNLGVKVNEYERDMIKKMAKEANMTPSRFLREVFLAYTEALEDDEKDA